MSDTAYQEVRTVDRARGGACLARPRSAACFARAQQVVAHGVCSPVRAFQEVELPPVVAQRGAGGQFWDVDGNCFIDLCSSWGALIHGHAHPLIVRAAQEAMAQGSTFGITTPLEERCARLIQRALPSMEKIRFVSSGTEATMSALRLARGYTGKKLLLKFAGHYHGHADPFLVQAGSGLATLNPLSSSAGVPEGAVEHTRVLPFNDCDAFLAAWRTLGEQVAAVIVEPVAANMGVVPADPQFLSLLRTCTQASGSLLIFDEVVTGFRVGLTGAQGLYGITPDLTCLGKIIGGGFPAAAFGGRAAIMELLAPGGPVYQAGTLSGNPVALAAGCAALELCFAPHFYETLARKTQTLLEPIQTTCDQQGLAVGVQQVGSLFTLFFGQTVVSNFQEAKACSLADFRAFYHKVFAQGVYLAPSQFEAQCLSAAHTEEQLEHIQEALLHALEVVSCYGKSSHSFYSGIGYAP